MKGFYFTKTKSASKAAQSIQQNGKLQFQCTLVILSVLYVSISKFTQEKKSITCDGSIIDSLWCDLVSKDSEEKHILVISCS